MRDGVGTEFNVRAKETVRDGDRTNTVRAEADSLLHDDVPQSISKRVAFVGKFK
jgi:hypothetical protein